MILRRILARTMQEALERVEREIGPDALLIDCRHEDGVACILARRPEHSPNSELAQKTEKSRRAQLLQELRDGGMSDALKKTLLSAAEGVDRHLRDADSPALRGVMRKIAHGLLRTSTTRARRVALVGPTGVGKTTTIAKLAARDALEARVACGIITTDTYRIAAVEQLRAFADMIDVPFRVAFTPLDLRRAFEELNGLDRIWIDTSGRNPRDAASIRTMRGFLHGREIETLLCLPAAGRRRDLLQALETYGSLDPSAWIVGKIDETDAPSELLSLAIEHDVPIAGDACGQRVPEDWRDARCSRYAQFLVPNDPRLDTATANEALEAASTHTQSTRR